MSKNSSQHHLLNANCPFGNNLSTNISCGPYLIIYFPLGFKIMNPFFISSHYIYDFFRLNLGYIPIVFGHLHTCCLLLVCEYMRCIHRATLTYKSKRLLQDHARRCFGNRHTSHSSYLIGCIPSIRIQNFIDL